MEMDAEDQNKVDGDVAAFGFMEMYQSVLNGVMDLDQYRLLAENLSGQWCGINILSDSGEQPVVLKFSAEQLKGKLFELQELVVSKKIMNTSFPYTYIYTRENPRLIKLYDPQRCGGSCSTSAPDPWWIFSSVEPTEEEYETLIAPYRKKQQKGFFSFLKIQA